MKRDKNLIVFGIPASTKKEPNEKQVDDENKIKELLTNVKINSDNIIKCFRLRSKDPNKPPPIIVETTYTVTRNNIVKAAQRKFEGIYVNPDLTEAQRRQDRQFRDELKKKNEPLNLINNWANASHYYVIQHKSFSTISLQQQSAFHKIPCCYTNATSLNNKMPEFLASIETYNPKIIFVTETWWHESSITNIKTIWINWDSSSIPTISNTNSLSSNFIDILAESFLIQFVTKPTFQLDEITSNNILDLIIAENENRVLDIIHHAPLTSLKKSHHVLQWYYVVKSAAVVGKHIEKRIYHKSNYVKIFEYFNNINWQMEFNGRNTDDCYNIFLNHYEAPCKTYVPVTKSKWIHRRSEWMNDDFKNKIKTKNKLWFRCRANGYKNLKLVNEYKARNIQLKKLIYKARCEFELDLVIKSKHSPKILFKHVNSKQNVRTTITALKGITITNPIKIANRLNNHFQSVFNKNEDDELPYFIKRTEAICKYSQITQDLVKNKLSDLSVDKTVGLDGVSAYVLKNCSDSFSIPSCTIFQKSLDSGCCPEVWKKANVTPL
ncbi:uncharacterized protein LOC124806291 [Hydra vulgaris]|uniref:uncharacterized protein LOC124806291 n=1 Tax=Hydra vulgaris TaxID=6087 RepID=UPI001F5F0696|nr:uncharacterized protein LOC124806291 [Hydra vulgaris]